MIDSNATAEETQPPAVGVDKSRDSGGLGIPATCFLHGEAIAVYSGGDCPICRTHEWLCKQVEAGSTNAETIRVHAAAIVNQAQMIDDRDARIKRYEERVKTMTEIADMQAKTNRTQSRTIDKAHQKLRDQAALVKSYEGSLESHETIRTILHAKIEELRGMVANLEEKIDELTPEVCPACDGEREVDCRNCMHPVPYDCGHELTCTECKDGKVPCAECGEGVTDG